MTSKLKLLFASGSISAVMLGANPAFAAGTTAGTDIDNSVTVNYQVGGVAQTEATASDSFKVDRKINLTVAEVGSATTTVSPNENGAITSFTVTNTSNEILDFALTAANGAPAHGGTDNFDVTGIEIFVEDGTTPGFQAAEDTEIYIDELAEDTSIVVYVLGNIPSIQASGDVAGVVLTATAREGGVTGGTVGATIAESGGVNTTGVETVFADTAGETDGNRDGAFSANDDYTVAAAAITVTKTSRVVSDPFNGTTNPKAIPGATIEYCIAVANAPGAADATGVAISDTVPTDLTYDGTFGVVTEGTVTGSTCNPDGAGTGSEAGGVVSGNLGTITAGTTETLIFQATVN